MFNLQLLAPEIVLSVLALALMAIDLILPTRRSQLPYHLGWISALVALACVVATLATSSQGAGPLWIVDPFSQLFKAMTLLAVIVTFLLCLEYEDLSLSQSGTFAALLLLSAVGLMLLVSATDLLFLFVSLELVAVSSFILAGFERRNRKSNEGAIKYFLFGAFSSAIFVYGLSLYYGAAGTTKLLILSQNGSSLSLWTPVLTGLGRQGPVLLLAMLFLLLGFGFKAAMVPMHFWVPDVYEGAPMPVTTFLSVAPKIAIMGVLLRVFTLLVPASGLGLTGLLALLAILTMTVGNTIAIFQDNVKRLLAYSSIAQAGYILIGIVTANSLGLEGVLLYSAVYIAMNVGAFTVLQAVGKNGSYELSAFDGLSRRSMALALTMAVFLLSLAGIPPLAGFIGKFYLFAAAMEAGRAAASSSSKNIFYALAVVGVINSVISVYYYMKIVYHMFFLPPHERSSAPAIGPYLLAVLAVCLAGVLAFGVWPEPLIAQMRISAVHLP